LEQTFVICQIIQFALHEIYLRHLQNEGKFGEKMNRLFFGMFVLSIVGCGSHVDVKKEDAGAGGAAATASAVVSAAPVASAADTAAPAATVSASAAPTASAAPAASATIK
jgi:hypothetical protein